MIKKRLAWSIKKAPHGGAFNKVIIFNTQLLTKRRHPGTEDILHSVVCSLRTA